MLSYHEECIATAYVGAIVARGNTGKFSAAIRTKKVPPSPKSRSATGCVSITVAVKKSVIYHMYGHLSMIFYKNGPVKLDQF